MNPQTIQTILFLEQLLAIGVKAVTELKAVAAGAEAKAIGDILDEADKRFLKVLSTSIPIGPDAATPTTPTPPTAA